MDRELLNKLKQIYELCRGTERKNCPLVDDDINDNSCKFGYLSANGTHYVCALKVPEEWNIRELENILWRAENGRK